MAALENGTTNLLQEILSSVKSLKQDHAQLASQVQAMQAQQKTAPSTAPDGVGAAPPTNGMPNGTFNVLVHDHWTLD